LSIAAYRDAGDRCANDVEALRTCCRSLPARRVILYEGDTANEIYQLFDGWAFRYKATRDGRRQILSFLLPGDLIDLPLLHLNRLGHAVKSLTPVSLCVFARDRLSTYLCARMERVHNAGTLCASLSAEAGESLLDLGRRSAAERIAHLCLRIISKLRDRQLASGPVYPFPLTQIHIADATGLTPAHVGRTLTELRLARLLSMQRGWLTVPDIGALQRI
jgi:CRP-like cAMP-binding protein